MAKNKNIFKNIKKKWLNLSLIVRYLIAAIVTLLVVAIVIPKGRVSSDENPFNISPISHDLEGGMSYSAQPIISIEVNNSNLETESSVTTVSPTSVSKTISSVSKPSLDEQEGEYDAFYSSLTASRRANNNPTSLPSVSSVKEVASSSSAPNGSSSSSSSTLTSSSSTLTSSSSSVSASSESSSVEFESSVVVEGSELDPIASTYVVQPGDNLYRIGANHNLSLEKIMELNGMTVPSVSVGQTIRIR